ncbi:MAG: DNA starvation/stationary phase protection protein Dps [Candidatus Binataceae bacterium]
MLDTELSNGASMNLTRDDLSLLVRREMVDLLNRQLACSIDLMQQARQAHWTVKGLNFMALHELFEKIAEGAAGYADLLAERTVQLGGVAEGTVQVVAANSQLDQYPAAISDSAEHLECMSSALTRYARMIRGAISECKHLGDAVSADILTEISRGAGKWLWFVEANKRGD